MATVVCRTEGCGNQGIPIEITTQWVDEFGETQHVDAVACGVCGQTITEVVG